MHYLLLLTEGVLTFVSPCLLPMLPVYLSYFAAGQGGTRRVVVNSLGFVAGFNSIFVLLGGFAGTVGGLLLRHATPVNVITGMVVVLLGLNFLGVINLSLPGRTRNIRPNTQELKFASSVIFGLVFAVGWTPCAGAFLGAALMRAAMQGGTLEGMAMLFVYSLGLGIPLVISAILTERLKGAFDFIKRNYLVINRVSGCFLIAVGIFMATGLMARYIAFFN